MQENRKKILNMLAEKKISVEEAVKLLELTGQEESGGLGEGQSKLKSKLRYIRVMVQPREGAISGDDVERVNVRIPVALIRAGMKFKALIPQHAQSQINQAFREKGMDFDISSLKSEDIEQLIEALGDFQVDAQNGKHNVRVYME